MLLVFIKFLEKVESPQVKLEKIKAVTAEDVQRVAQEIFVNSKLHLAVAGQHEEKEERKFRKAITF